MTSHLERAPRTSPEAALTQPETYLTRDWGGENVFHVFPPTFVEDRAEGIEHSGVGSILGIRNRLDWMLQSGITTIWLGPIYESPGELPGRDGPYDISDHMKINPKLGTMEEFQELLAEAHARDIRVIIDLVPNHTSDEDERFKASSDPEHPQHEEFEKYYYWCDSVKGTLPEGIVGGDRLEGLPEGMTVPNNWTSIFSGPLLDELLEQYNGEIPDTVTIPALTAWVWHKGYQKLYLAEFTKGQPTLNWSHEPVREAFKDVIRFYLDMGVDGFRVDVMNHIGKNTALVDEKLAPIGTAIGEYTPGVKNPHDGWGQTELVSHYPELGDYSMDFVSVLDEEPYRDRNIRFVFEDWIAALNGDTRLDNLRPDKANVFNFEMLLNTDRAHWVAPHIGKIVRKYYERMQSLPGAVPNQVTGNHDVLPLRARLESAMAARAAQVMLGALPGAYYVWQADMMGRPNMIVPEELQRDGKIGGRDGTRILIAWNDKENGGFSHAAPEDLWLPSVDEKIYRSDNLELQARDPNSPYRLMRDVLQRRQADPALHEGEMRILHTDNDAKVFAFARHVSEDHVPDDPRRQVISITNFSPDTVSVSVLDAQQMRGRVTLSSSGHRRDGEIVDLERPIILLPDESCLIDSVA
jgi:alpha-glucosidase